MSDFRVPSTIRQTSQNTGVVHEPTEAWMHLRATDPLVAWWTYIGVLKSVGAGAGDEFMSLWAVRASLDALSSGGFFRREYVIELARRNYSPDAISRLKGLFVFPNHDTLDRATGPNGWGDFHDHYAQKVFLQPGSIVSWHDTTWLSHLEAPSITDTTSDAAVGYVSGTASGTTPHWEFLVEGVAVTDGTELREKAYNVVKHTWPESVGFLEIGRLAAGAGLDAGYVAAFPIDAGDTVELKWMINFPGNDPDFIQALRKHMESLPEHEINGADLAPISDEILYRLPDLTGMTRRIPKTQWPWTGEPQTF